MAESPAVVGPECPLCHSPSPLLLCLRDCHHIVCLPCILAHLKYWILEREKARIKCPRGGCHVRIHENDINAVLDPAEKFLDVLMPLEHRIYMQYKHYKHQVYYALGGLEMVRRCPLCKSVYCEVRGCHNVVCANKRCGTRFCWQCGHPVASLAHFTGGICSFGWDDVYRGVYPVRFFLHTDAPTLIAIIPWVYGILFVSWPLLLFVGVPGLVCHRIYEKATARSNMLFPEEWIVLIAKMVLSYVFLLPVSLLLALCSYPTSCFLVFYYVYLISIKMSMPFKKCIKCWTKCRFVPDCLLPTGWKQMLQDAAEAKNRSVVDDYQKQEEYSERLPAGGCITEQPTVLDMPSGYSIPPTDHRTPRPRYRSPHHHRPSLRSSSSPRGYRTRPRERPVERDSDEMKLARALPCTLIARRLEDPRA